MVFRARVCLKENKSKLLLLKGGAEFTTGGFDGDGAEAFRADFFGRVFGFATFHFFD